MKKESSFTSTGLPLHQPSFIAAPAVATADANDDAGPARRIDCRPAPLLAAPSLRPVSKRVPSRVKSVSLNECAMRRSLIDDDEEEVVDYFHLLTNSGPALTVGPAVTVNDARVECPWNVRENNVPTLPACYPLEKSVVFVPQASAQILAARVVSVLKARSISATYDAKNAKADCVTSSLVDFRIRLYRGRGEYNHGIIVEVARREGFDISYAQDVYAILDAVEGKNETYDFDSAPIQYFDSDEGNSSEEEEDMDSLENTAGLASLRVISDILCPQEDDKTTVEGRDFALASLASLTSLDRMGQTAIKHSNELLSLEEHASLRQAVLSHVSRGPQLVPQRPLLQSLEILANVATLSTQRPSQLVDALSQNDYGILTNLIVNVENAQLNPRAADLSCVILKHTYRSQQEGSSIVDTMMPSQYRERLMSALMKAVGYGSSCHAELERSSGQCLEILM